MTQKVMTHMGAKKGKLCERQWTRPADFASVARFASAVTACALEEIAFEETQVLQKKTQTQRTRMRAWTRWKHAKQE